MDVLFVGDHAFRQLEEYGIALANDTIGRLRDLQLEIPESTPIIEGPHFVYEQGPSLFLGRRGRGPLHIAWDTNLLIDYFDIGAELWEGEALPQLMPGSHGEELEALQLLISLWILRDIRFHILPKTVTDSKNKPLSSDRRRRRSGAWREFCSALTLVDGGEEPGSPPLILPSRVQENALQRVPAGNDRELVRAALHRRLHVFLTCDRGILKAAPDLKPCGLLVTTPQELLGEISLCGALLCMLAERFLYWPMPDQQRVAHLIRALGESRILRPGGPSALLGSLS